METPTFTYFEFKGCKTAIKKLASILIDSSEDFKYDSMTGHISWIQYDGFGLQARDVFQQIEAKDFEIWASFPCSSKTFNI